MAGSGGGPPRKSHTKSRTGCRTCKRRHIRCDESFPQWCEQRARKSLSWTDSVCSRNCKRHSVRCDYMDMPAAGEELIKGTKPPELLMSPELQEKLDNWRLTGEAPLPELRSADATYWTRFSTIDLRLVHHITILSRDFLQRGYTGCTPWAAKMNA